MMRRRGGSALGLLVVLGLIGGLSVAAVFVSPRVLVGASVDDPGAPRTSEHRAVLEALAALVGNSDRVLAVHERGPTPYVELVLWMSDRRNPGVVDFDEVGVLSHSRMLRSITFFGLTGTRHHHPELPADVAVIDPRFCEVWRSRSDVVPRVIAAGVSDMQVEPRQPRSTSGQTLCISLTWAADSSDAADEGSVLVDVFAQDGAKE